MSLLSLVWSSVQFTYVSTIVTVVATTKVINIIDYGLVLIVEKIQQLCDWFVSRAVAYKIHRFWVRNLWVGE